MVERLKLKLIQMIHSQSIVAVALAISSASATAVAVVASPSPSHPQLPSLSSSPRTNTAFSASAIAVTVASTSPSYPQFPSSSSSPRTNTAFRGIDPVPDQSVRHPVLSPSLLSRSIAIGDQLRSPFASLLFVLPA